MGVSIVAEGAIGSGCESSLLENFRAWWLVVDIVIHRWQKLKIEVVTYGLAAKQIIIVPVVINSFGKAAGW
jgi:hypothetical protein